MRACGPALTVSCHPADNIMLITAISLAKPGDVLQPGSPLAVLDSPDLVQANADLVAASVTVRKAQNQVTLAERVAKRQRLLFDAGAGAYKDAEQAESDLRNAQHDLKMAEGEGFNRFPLVLPDASSSGPTTPIRCLGSPMCRPCGSSRMWRRSTSH